MTFPLLSVVRAVEGELPEVKELLPDELIEAPSEDAAEVKAEPRASYNAAGLRFVGSGNEFSSIGGYSTSGMTFAGNGGLVLYQAFSNLDAAIADVEAKAISSTDFDLLLNKYLGQAGTLNNIWDLINAVNNNLVSFDSRVKTALASANSSLSSVISGIGTTNDKIGGSVVVTGTDGGTLRVSTILGALSAISAFQKFAFSSSHSIPFLTYDGSLSSSSGIVGVAYIMRCGFSGLSANIAGSDKITAFSLLSPGEDGGMESLDATADNLLDALGLLGTHLQNPLAKLQYVLADDDDIKLKDATKENQDSFTDNFTGGGSGAVSGSQINDVAGIGSDVQQAFAGAGSFSDIFTVLNDSGNYGFFSQEVADALTTVGTPAAVSESSIMNDILEDYDVDESGILVPKHSLFDISEYLEGIG